MRDLDGDGEPEVLVDVSTGGAHCCAVSWVLRWDGATYAAVAHNWGDAAYRLQDVDGDGAPEFRSADTRFAYAFTAYAFSGFPVMTLAYRQGVFRDVTRRHEALVRQDARRQMREYRKRRSGRFSLGVLAAWTADQYLLGKRGRRTGSWRRNAARAGCGPRPPGSPRGPTSASSSGGCATGATQRAGRRRTASHGRSYADRCVILACVQSMIASPQALAELLARLLLYLNRASSPEMFRLSTSSGSR